MKANLLIKKYKRLIRFSIVGLINTIVDFTIFIFLNKFFGLYFIFSQILGYAGGVINSFILNKIWTFKDKGINEKTPKQFAKFMIINLVSLSSTLIGMNIFVNYLNISVVVSKIMVTFISQIINYMGYKLCVFNSKIINLN